MPMQSLEDAFVEELRDLLSAEKQLTHALPQMAKAASNEELRECFEHHLEETKEQVSRLEQVFKSVDKAARAKKCEAMEGLIEEAKELMEKKADDSVKDAILIAAAQKVEHYEIAAYGTLCTWAEMLGNDRALKLLQQTLQEEKTADETLTKAAGRVNETATASAG